jgi:hypothetical protein
MKSGYVAAALILAGALVMLLGISPDGALDLAAKATLAGR